jgi:hypothetical protein
MRQFIFTAKAPNEATFRIPEKEKKAHIRTWPISVPIVIFQFLPILGSYRAKRKEMRQELLPHLTHIIWLSG